MGAVAAAFYHAPPGTSTFFVVHFREFEKSFRKGEKRAEASKLRYK